MKKTITVLTALFIIIGGVLAQSGATTIQDSFRLFESGDQFFYLMYPDKTPGKVKIRFKDGSGKILTTDFVRNKKGFRKGYDLTTLPAGDYSVEVTDANGMVTQDFNIRNEIDLAVLKLKNGRYKLLVDNAEQQVVDVKIYDKSGEMLFSENHKTSFARVYDLSRVGSEHYHFELATATELHRLKIE